MSKPRVKKYVNLNCRLDTANAKLEPELFRKTELNVKEDLTQLETKQVTFFCCPAHLSTTVTVQRSRKCPVGKFC